MRRTFFNNRITIEKEEKVLSSDNVWISKYTEWKSMWASVLLRDLSKKNAVYLFCVRWINDFPTNFRIKIGDKMFIPTQLPVLDPPTGTILFHAVSK